MDDDNIENRSSAENKNIYMISYFPLLGWLPFLIPTDDPFLKKHERQAFLLSVGEFMLIILISPIGNYIRGFLFMCFVACGVYGAYCAYKNEEFKIPVISDFFGS